MNYVINKRKKKLFYTFNSKEGNVLLKGNEHQYIAACEGKVQMIIDMSCDENKYHHRKTEDDQFYFFEMHNPEGEAIGVSPMFKTHELRTAAIKMMMAGVCGKTMKELAMDPVKKRWYYARGDYDGMNYQCYQSEIDQLYYYDILEGEQIVFTSCKYENRFDCQDAVKTLKDKARNQDRYTLNKDEGAYTFDLVDDTGVLVGKSMVRQSRKDVSQIAALISGKGNARVITDDELRRAEAERLYAKEQKAEQKRIAEEKRKAAEERKREERKIEEARRKEERKKEMERARAERKKQEEEEERLAEEAERKKEQEKLDKERRAEEKRKMEEQKRADEREAARLRREAKKEQKRETQETKLAEAPKKRKAKVVEEEVVESKSSFQELLPVLVFLGLLAIAIVGFVLFGI